MQLITPRFSEGEGGTVKEQGLDELDRHGGI